MISFVRGTSKMLRKYKKKLLFANVGVANP